MRVYVCVVSEVVRMRVDPVYAALRYGTSLAQMSRSSFGSLSESPTRSLVRQHHPVGAGRKSECFRRRVSCDIADPLANLHTKASWTVNCHSKEYFC